MNGAWAKAAARYSRFCNDALCRCKFYSRLRGVIVLRSFSKRIAWVCLLLALWSALAFAAHDHASSIEAAKCTVCIAAHSAAPTVTHGSSTARFVSVATVRARAISVQYRIIPFALSVRPPPEV